MTSSPGPNGPDAPRRDEPSWDRLFSPEDFASPKSAAIAPVVPRITTSRSRQPLILTAVAILVVAAVVTGVVIWLVRPSADESDTGTTASTSAGPSVDADPRPAAPDDLVKLLPAGYSPRACAPGAAPTGAQATLTCGRNADRGGPASATYTLVDDTAALTAAFDQVVKTSTVVECPGRIQSPGPWRRRADPQQDRGILLCAVQANRPLVAWTNRGDLLLSVARAGPQGPPLVDLYAWWSAHS